MNKYKIASIAGDGIGKEVLPESIKILKETAKKHQFQIQFDNFDFASCDYYQKNGKMHIVSPTFVSERDLMPVIIKPISPEFNSEISFGLGVKTPTFSIKYSITGTIGDKVSLGFVHATEEGVAAHLKEHLQKLPADDRKSQLVLQQMLVEEERHGEHALEHGGEEFPSGIKRVMRASSQLMTKTTYWL